MPSSSSVPLGKSESMAYPKTGSWANFSFCIRQNTRAVIATLAFLAFVLIITLDSVQGSSGGGGVSGGLRPSTVSSRTFVHFGGAAREGYFVASDSIKNDHTFRFAAVTDLDQLSLENPGSSSKLMFRSILLSGSITRNPTTNRYTIQFESENQRKLVSHHNEAGRGMELSELTLYQNRLLTFDDRTGTVFEILNSDDGTKSFVVPRFVITEGEGETDKGMKWEWATEKNGNLIMGSMGKEYTRPNGSIENRNNLWISQLSPRGELTRINWTHQYGIVRAALGASAPGYCIHEAILWSNHLRKWIFVPRRVSSEAYDEDEDERRGSNKLVVVDEAFSSPKVVTVAMAHVNPLHGFSSIAFVPGTKDRHVLATRTVEENCVGGDEALCQQRSYFMVFDVLTGEVLMEEVKYPKDGLKFEGVEFVDIHTVPPKPKTDAPAI